MEDTVLPPVEERIEIVQKAIANAKREVYACRLNARAQEAVGGDASPWQEKAEAFLKALAVFEEELASLEAVKEG